MMAFKNILVPYDGSQYAIRALKAAIDLTKKYNSNLTLVTVILKSYRGGIWFTDSRAGPIIIKKLRKAATEDLLEARNIAKKKGVEIGTGILESNSVPQKILSFAKSKKIDLIVMGTHGRTGLDKLILGSVANGVSQQASCAVLLVR